MDIDTERELHIHEHQHLHARSHIRNARVRHRKREMQCVNKGPGQFSIVLQLGNIGDKLDELVELFSEHIEGIRAEVTRYGTKETKYKT